MIRRQVGEEYWLIQQHDHALAAAELARRVGSPRFRPPSGEPAHQGIALHDSGWPLHDDQPTLNRDHRPLDVFESPRQVTLPVWQRSVELAVERDPYAGLLVSIHVLKLSAFAVGHGQAGSGSWDMNDPRTRFEVNVFQHRIIEIQETLRTRMGLRTDLPLAQGLAPTTTDPREIQLIHDLWWLQAADQMSLALCCTRSPFDGHSDLKLHWKRMDHTTLKVFPWPFAQVGFKLNIPFRPIPARRYDDPADLAEELSRSSVQQFTATVQRDTI